LAPGPFPFRLPSGGLCVTRRAALSMHGHDSIANTCHEHMSPRLTKLLQACMDTTALPIHAMSTRACSHVSRSSHPWVQAAMRVLGYAVLSRMCGSLSRCTCYCAPVRSIPAHREILHGSSLFRLPAPRLVVPPLLFDIFFGGSKLDFPTGNLIVYGASERNQGAPLPRLWRRT
jgi:hypothetical protein